MKLRAFVLSLSLAGLGGGASLAQSGYVTIRFATGYQFVGSQMNVSTNKVSQLLPTPPEGAVLYKFANGTFTTNKVSSGVWTNPDETLEPGEGAIVFNPGRGAFQVTFAGPLLQGNLVNRIPAGLSLKCSLVPQAGRITTDLQLTLSPFDNVYEWKTNRYEIYTFLPDGSWFPSEPTISVGRAFFVRANRQTEWIRVFNLNQ